RSPSLSTLFPYTTLFRSHDHILPYSFTALATGTPPYWTTLSDLTNPVFPHDTNLTTGPPPPFQFNAFPATVREPTKNSYNLTLRSEEHTSELQSRSDLVC